MSQIDSPLRQFLGYGIKIRKNIAEKYVRTLFLKKSKYWNNVQNKKLLSLFHYCSVNVKAYKDFLKKARISSDKISSIDDLKSVLPVNKNNYLRAYTWEKLCSPHSLVEQSLVLTSTSGSTGQPFYFPRNGMLDAQSSIYHYLFMRTSRVKKNKSTLVIICFGMGVWIGGTITYQAFKSISDCGFPLTIITPGVNKKEIFEALKNIAPKFHQIILCGYPPFMKDIIDEANNHDINWKSLNLKLIFAAEGFSENFRSYIIKKTGIKDYFRDTMNIYGSADLGTMAEETPICILIRKLTLKKPELFTKLFSDATRLPTLAQYIPDFINFEASNNHVYVSGDNVLPLLRYEIGDNGGVFSFEQMNQILKNEGLDIKKEAKAVGILDTITELPFVYVYERTDLSTKLYGAIIYPEYIKIGLQRDILEKYITGKFTLFTKHNEIQDEYLEINVELKNGIIESEWLRNEIEKSVYDNLKSQSAEYTYLTGMLNDRVKPRIIFWPYEHPQHFQTGTKQKWVKK